MSGAGGGGRAQPGGRIPLGLATRAALGSAVLSGALAADAERVIHPGARFEGLIALAWTIFPLVLAARVGVAGEQRGWPAAWRLGVRAGTLALAVASLARAVWARAVAAEGQAGISVAVWSVALTAAAAALALAVSALARGPAGHRA